MKQKTSKQNEKKNSSSFWEVLDRIGRAIKYTSIAIAKSIAKKVAQLWKRFRALNMEKQRVIAAVGILGMAGVLFSLSLVVGISACAKHGTATALAEEIPVSDETDRLRDAAGASVEERSESILAEAESDTAESVQPEFTAEAETDANLSALLSEQTDTIEALDEAVEPESAEVVVTVPEEEPEPTPEPLVLKKHDESPEVMDLQLRLIKLGYLEIDEPTEYYGSATEYAVKLFQRQHDLGMDGVAGTQTLELLYSKDAQKYTLKEGAEGRDVKMLQEQLVDLGYLSSKQVDSVYGAVTTEAVMAFQKRNKLTADGLAGEKTLEKLYSDTAKISAELAAQQKAEAEAAAKKEKEEAEKAAAKAKEEAAKAKEQSAKAKEEAAKKKEAEKKAQEAAAKESRIDKFISAASSKIGCEYVLGDRGPNTFDCSGFVWYCLKQAGVSTTRLNAAGYSEKSGWKEIKSYSSVQRGDILFFRSDESSRVSHTGIYVGGGMMIDASSGNGKVVKRSVSAYWKRNFVNARRPW